MMKKLFAFLTVFVLLFALISCDENVIEEPQLHFDEMTFSVDEFPCYDSDGLAVGTYDTGKTEWEEGDQLFVVAETGAYATLTRNADGVWTTRDATNCFNADSKIVVTYAPNCTIVDGQVTPKADIPFGLGEYFSTEATFDETQISISFSGVERAYSRVRISAIPLQTIVVEVTAFTPAGAVVTRADDGDYCYEITTDEKGNAYLYGIFSAGATIRASVGDNVFTELTLSSATESGQSYAFNSFPETVKLPAGFDFNTALTEVLGSCTKIKFVAESQQVSDQVLFVDENGQKAYAVINEDCLEIHALVSRFEANSDCDGLLYDLKTVTAIDFNGCFDTSNVTSMRYMFSGCHALQTLDVSDFNTSNVTSMAYMFEGCQNLTSLDVSGFDTSNVTDMSSMFAFCDPLTSLDVSGFNTSKVTNMAEMFRQCRALTSLDVSGFDTSNVTDMSNMFVFCIMLTTLDVSGFNTSKVTDMNAMFGYCSSLRALDLSGFDTSMVTSISGMFTECSGLTSLDVSGFDTSNVTTMRALFKRCMNLSALDVSGFNTANVTDMVFMFSQCSSLTSLDVSGFDTSKVTEMSLMFEDCSSLTSLDVSSFTFTSNPSVLNMFSGFGKAIPVIITKAGYEYMNSQRNCGILDSNSWFVVDGTKIQPEGFVLLGDAQYYDDIVPPLFRLESVEYTVKAYTHTRKPGYILLQNAYTKAHPYKDYGTYTSEDTYFEIDVSDPSAVVVPEQVLGLDWGYGDFSVRTLAPGTMVDNVITFPANALCVAMANYMNGTNYYTNPNGLFRVILPKVNQ